MSGRHKEEHVLEKKTKKTTLNRSTKYSFPFNSRGPGLVVMPFGKPACARKCCDVTRF